MKILKVSAILSVIILSTAFVTAPINEPDSSIATIEVVSLDESQEITFEGTFIFYETDQTNGFKTFGKSNLTTPYSVQMESSDFVAVFKKKEGNANMRVTLTIENDKALPPLKSGGDNSIVVRKGQHGYAQGL